MANSKSDLKQSTAPSAADSLADLDGDTWDNPAGSDVLVPGKSTRRSALNIAMWSSYLPSDCVKTMIKMGWHKTT